MIFDYLWLTALCVQIQFNPVSLYTTRFYLFVQATAEIALVFSWDPSLVDFVQHFEPQLIEALQAVPLQVS